MMALRKEPHLRYRSAEAFAQDIERHLNGLPVKARRSTVAYRSAKFVRRHREAVIAAAVAVSLVGLGGTWESYRARRKAATPAAAATRKPRPSIAVLGLKNASGRSDTAWVSTALAEMLNTELASGESLRVLAGETVARSRIDLKLPESENIAPDALAHLRTQLGVDFVVSGEYAETGIGQLRLQLNLQDASRGKIADRISESGSENNLPELVGRAGTRLRAALGVPAVSPFDAGHVQAAAPSNAEALRLYSEGVARLRTFDALAAQKLLERSIAADDSFPLSHMALALSWQNLGYDQRAAQQARRALDLAGRLSREDYLVVEARFFEASRNWEKAIETYHALFTFFPDNLEYALSLARAQSSAAKGKDALATLAALDESGTRDDDPRIDLARSDAGSALGDAKLRRDAAESAAQKAAKQGARLLVARARTQECRALADLGENEKAGPVCEEGRRIYVDIGDRGGLARILHSAAEVPLNQDDWVTAERLYREALALTREIGDRQGTARELGNLALTFKYRGDLATALEMQREALQIQSEISDRNGMAIQTGNIGNSLRLEGKLGEALAFYRRSLDLSKEIGNKTTEGIAAANIGTTLALAGDLAQALTMYQRALALHRERGAKYYYADTLHSIGALYRQRFDFDRARRAYTEALAVRRQIAEKDAIAATQLALAELDSDAGKAAAAQAVAAEALAVFRAQNEPAGEVSAYVVLSRALRAQNRLADARKNLDAAMALAGRNYDIAVQADVTIEQISLLIAERNLEPAAKLARQMIAQFQRNGIVRYQLEASLELGRIQALENSSAAGTTFQEVRETAHRKGFELIAHQADSVSTPLEAAK
jgi:tetratricopeptide (TPR) repeat protein